MVKKLSAAERSAALQEVPEWTEVEGRDAISRSFKFKDFSETFDFMSQCAIKAEEIGHHPEWFNVYNRVDVTLTTHDCDGVSERDIELAKFMDIVAR